MISKVATNYKNESINALDDGLDDGIEGNRIDVVIGERDGRDIIALQLSTWSEGTGWQAQKTIPLSADRIAALQRLLSQTRNRIEDKKLPAGARADVIDIATSFVRNNENAN